MVYSDGTDLDTHAISHNSKTVREGAFTERYLDTHAISHSFKTSNTHEFS